ncbi:MAG: RHS repeat-associated core domain-containing protein, partial [Flavobacteriaceae bacterium]
DGANTTTEYTYDQNGNMLRDLNKGMTADMGYNHLNLPTSVSMPGGTISYIYNAVGTKLKKTAGSSVTEYAGNYIYENGNLQFFNHSEGYVTPDGSGGFDYVYQYKDHLGNIRLSYQDANNNGSIATSEIIEENNYYPFGLEHKGYNSVVNGVENNYQTFQGEELEEDLGKNTIAYQWRDYDPAIGRFNKIDRFAIKYESHSPYGFTKNNPVRYREMAGDSIWTTERTNKRGHTIVTTHFRGKVLNTSDRNIDTKEYAKQLQRKLSSALYGSDGDVKYRSDVQIEAVDSVDDVDSSDHLQVIVDDVEGKSAKGGEAGGLAPYDGKVSYVEAGGFFSPVGMQFMTDTGVHELGHNFGLKHNWEDFLPDSNGSNNYMGYSSERWGGFSIKQLQLITRNIEFLNQGSPTQKAPSSSNNWIYHNSTNSQPYDFNVKKGDIIPTIIKNE